LPVVVNAVPPPCAAAADPAEPVGAPMAANELEEEPEEEQARCRLELATAWLPMLLLLAHPSPTASSPQPSLACIIPVGSAAPAIALSEPIAPPRLEERRRAAPVPPPPPPMQQQTPELNCGRSQAGPSGVVRPAQVTDKLFAVHWEGQEYVARVYGERVGSFMTEDEAMARSATLSIARRVGLAIESVALRAMALPFL
jgi:hypothetical protein